MTGSLRPRLVVLEGGAVTSAREIGPGEEWTLGRGADAAVTVPERSVSRAHARVFCDAAGVHLEDLGTPNGTFVDGQRLEGTLTLRDGNLIRLGQSTNPDPILLRFEDPGTRLLEAMVATPVPEEPPRATTTESEVPTLVGPGEGEPPAAVVPLQTGVGVPSAAEAAAVEDEGLPPPPPSGADEFEVATPATRARAAVGALSRRLGWHIAFWAAGAVLLVWGFVALLHSTQKPWQSVRVEPQRVREQSRVSIRGVEVEPAETLRIFLADIAAPIEEMKVGEVVFRAPALPASEAGVRTVTLRVERKGIVLLRQNLHYETRPEVVTVGPTEVAVGDTVAVEGQGFASQASRVKVLVNQVPARVLAASSARVEFVMPVVTREAPVEGLVEVQVGEWTTAPVGVRVTARDAPCYPLVFEARAVAERIWEVRHALGPVLYLEGPSSGTGGVPAPVESAVTRLSAAFEAAASDPSVRFDVRESRSPALVAIGVTARSTEVVRWSRRLDGYLRELVPELRQTELLPFWSAVVLNEMLNVFAKKQAPGLLPDEHPLRQALARLHQLNYETGGQGCPTEVEIRTLTAAERDAFDHAVLRLPHRFGEVGGVWEGTFEDIFSEMPTQTRLELRLELEQTGTALKGRAFVFEVRGPGIRWSPPPIENLTGRVKLSAETRVELTVPPQPPYHLTRLAGVVAQDTLSGIYRTERNKEGTFQLVMRSGE